MENPKRAVTSTIDAGGNSCHLCLPAVGLTFQSKALSQPTTVYFASQITKEVSEEDPQHYFACFGDVIGELVFVGALYESGMALPQKMLFLRHDAFKKWLVPSSDEGAKIVPNKDDWIFFDPFK
jgi:hypothetical protein